MSPTNGIKVWRALRSVLLFLFCSSANLLLAGDPNAGPGEFYFIYKGEYYRKAKVAEVSPMGVTVTCDRGRVVVPVNVLPYNIQRSVKQRLAAMEAERLAQQKAAAAKSGGTAPGAATAQLPPSPAGDSDPSTAEKPPISKATLRNLLFGGVLSVLAFLFVLAALMGNNRLRSLALAVACAVGATIPLKKGISVMLGWETADEAQKWTVESAQAEATRRYPDLAVSGSAMNKAYLALHEKYRREDPAYFESPDWPLLLAEEVAESH